MSPDDFRERLLPGADLRGITFPVIRQGLSGIDLRGANLRGADLTDASSWLYGVDFENANLTGADLRDTALGTPDFTRALLVDANLTGIHIGSSPETGGATFTAANLTRARLTGARILNANFTDAVLIDADLTHCILIAAKLTNADLTGANLTGTDLRLATLTNAILIGANLTDTVLPDPDLLVTMSDRSAPRDPSLRTKTLELSALAGATYSPTTQWPAHLLNPRESPLPAPRVPSSRTPSSYFPHPGGGPAR